jgi:hypothetical protein
MNISHAQVARIVANLGIDSLDRKEQLGGQTEREREAMQ